MNSKVIFIIVYSFIFVGTGLSQQGADSVNANKIKTSQLNAADLQRNAIINARFLGGRWEGTEWILMPDGRRQTCIAYDFAEAKLNGTLLLFQGGLKVNIPPENDTIIVYEGMGILSYDENSQKYHLMHFGTDGSYEMYECTLTGKNLLCERRDKDNAFIRITLGVDDSGRWIERGERSQDKTKWITTFETQMNKVTSAGTDKH